MAETVLVNGFEDGGGDHQMSLSVNGMSGCPADDRCMLPLFICL